MFPSLSLNALVASFSVAACPIRIPCPTSLPCLLATVVAGGAFFALFLVLAFGVRRKLRSNEDVPLWMACLQSLVMAVLRIRYRFKVTGLENLPLTGPVLLASNHISFIEAIILSAIAHRRLRFLVWHGYQGPAMRLIIRLFRLIPVSPEHAKDAVRVACTHLAAGDCVAVFPEGQISRNGTLGAFQGGCALIARRSGANIVPAAVEGLWGSLFSFYDGPGFLKLPRFGRPLLNVAFGTPIPPSDAATLRDRVQLLLTEMFSSRPEFEGNLGARIVHNLARHPGRIFIIDRGGATRLVVRGATLYALARHVARALRPQIGAEPRVAILLPPGVAAAVANLAVLMLNRSPVNLNFTLGRKQFEGCITITGLKTFITAQALRDKLDEKIPDFPWGSMERIVDIANLLNPKTLPKLRLLADILAAWVLPGCLLRALCGVRRRGGDGEATVLCTSGSSGMPKGVPLSHRNILANCFQFGATRMVPPDSVILGNLPVFHSFGITVTLWYPLTCGIQVVNTTSPLEMQKNITAIREERPNILLGTPTFFRAYLKKAEPADMRSVRFVVAGAEKTPARFAEEWEKRFEDCLFIEGYGATETTPVAALNLRDIKDPNARDGIYIGNCCGSVGRPAVGISVRFTNPIDGSPGGESGVLWLKGANVFGGYLNQPELTREALTPDGWYCTGDIARRDAEGFIHIEGRQSRFSKIAGEMVSHGAVEDAIRHAIGMKFGEDSQQRIAIGARLDESKGEALVLLTTVDVDNETFRDALVRDGIANLWIPRIIKRVDAIPVLATGKLDLQRIHELAAEG